METAYQVILAEDHVRFRSEIKKIINGIPGVKVMAEAGDGYELFNLLEKSQPDLIIMDIAMPNLRAMQATREVKAKYPAVKVIIMVMDIENEYLSHAIAAGAEGIILKQDSAMDLKLAVQRIRRGKGIFPTSRRPQDLTSRLSLQVSLIILLSCVFARYFCLYGNGYLCGLTGLRNWV